VREQVNNLSAVTRRGISWQNWGGGAAAGLQQSGGWWGGMPRTVGAWWDGATTEANVWTLGVRRRATHHSHPV